MRFCRMVRLKLAQKKIAPRGMAFAQAEAETGSAAGSSGCSCCAGELPLRPTPLPTPPPLPLLLPGTTGKRCDHHPFFFLRAR